jgi:tetrahydromethanopterin S-methyltransferase subunit G
MSDNEELLSWMAKWKANFSEIDLNELKDNLELAHEKINFNKGEIQQNFQSINIQNSKIIKNEISIDDIKKKLADIENDQLDQNKNIENNKK